ncbi:MAG TPA: hypothetical protein VKE69_03075, partial [Planctomycetota bacterium]|nr:hypothetical protein [Planctomycetota bacterium]
MTLVLELALLAAGFAALFPLAHRLHARLERSGTTRRFAIGLAGVLVLLVPAAGALAALDEWIRERRLAADVEGLAPALDSLARGAIGPLESAGASSIFNLARGETVRPAPNVVMRALDLRAPGAERRSAEEDLPFVVRERTLAPEETLTFRLERPGPVERIGLAVASGVEIGPGGVEAAIVGATGARQPLAAGPRWSRLHGWGEGASRVEIAILEPAAPAADAVGVEVRAGGSRARVAGACAIAPSGAVALLPEERTRTGVPFAALGSSPGSGIAIRPGAPAVEVAFPAPVECDRLWLVYAATDPRAADYRWFGEDVVEIRVEYDGPALPGLLRLQHGLEIHSASLDRSPHADDFRSAVAFTWESEGARWHADQIGWTFEAPQRIRGLALRNRSGASGYAVELLGVSVGTAAAPASAPARVAPLLTADGGIAAPADLVQRLRGVRLAWVDRRGVIRAVEAQESRRFVGAQIEEGALRTMLQRRAGSLRSVAGLDADAVALPVQEGEAVAGALLAYRPDPGRAIRSERFAWVPVAASLASIPFFVVLFLASLARGSRIRTKVAVALAFAALVPVVALLVAVPGPFGRARREAAVRRLEAEAEAARERLDRAREAAPAEAAAFLDALLDHPRAASLFAPPARADLDDALRREMRALRGRLFEGTPAFARLELRLPGPGDSPWRTVDDHDGGLAPGALDLPASDYYRVGGRLAVVGVPRPRIDGERRIRLVLGKDATRLAESSEGTRLVAIDGSPLGARPLPDGVDHATVGSAVAAALRSNLPAPVPSDPLGIVDVVRDQGGEPLFAIAVFEPASHGDVVLLGSETSLPTLLGVVAVLGAVSALAAARILTERITSPIERLASAADEARLGQSIVAVDAGAGDELGALAERLGAMSFDLVRRIEHLGELQRGMLGFAARLDRQEVAREASRFVASAARADGAWVLLPDPRGRGWTAFASDGRARVIRLSPLLQRCLAADEWCFVADDAATPLAFLAPADRRLVDGASAVLAGPVRSGTRSEGLVVVAFRRSPDAAQRGAASAATSAVAIALENARVHAIAIEDEATGALVGRFFALRIEEAIERARALGRSLWAVRVELVPLAQGATEAEATIRALARRVLRVAARGSGALVGRTGSLEITAATDEGSAEGRARLARGLVGAARRLAGPSAEVRSAQAVYPSDAPSAELLLAKLRVAEAGDRPGPDLSRFVGGAPPVSPAMKETVGRAARLAGVDLPVILFGEPGTGREWLA